MNIKQKRELHDFIYINWAEVPEKAIYIHGVSSDNAYLTCTENGYPFSVHGRLTDEFIDHWHGTVVSCLADAYADAESEAWFAARGVKA